MRRSPRIEEESFRCCVIAIVGAEDDDVKLLRCASPAPVTVVDRRVLGPEPK
jgi:hypothetical protein